MSARDTAELLSELSRPPVQARMLDWLRRSLGPEHPAARAIGPLGDPETAAAVPIQRWRDALATAAEYAPGETPGDRWRWLGAQVAEGFFASELGGLIARSLQGAPAERYVSTFPKVLALSRSDVSADIRPDAAGGWLVRVTDDQAPLPEFVAGSLEQALHRAAPDAKVAVASQDPTGYTLRASW